MRKVIKRIAHIVFVVVVLLLAAYTFLMAKYPEETAQITGYRLYAVLTDSMEPRIPTISLVCTKVLDPEEPLHLKKGDIITFKADRFGDDILLTHHFNKTEKDFQGNTIYRTNAEGKDNLDTVSYTHLDVYKRQASLVEDVFISVLLGSFLCAYGTRLFFKAVSYTHLDVYKRQRSSCGSTTSILD